MKNRRNLKPVIEFFNEMEELVDQLAEVAEELKPSRRDDFSVLVDSVIDELDNRLTEMESELNRAEGFLEKGSTALADACVEALNTKANEISKVVYELAKSANIAEDVEEAQNVQ